MTRPTYQFRTAEHQFQEKSDTIKLSQKRSIGPPLKIRILSTIKEDRWRLGQSKWICVAITLFNRISNNCARMNQSELLHIKGQEGSSVGLKQTEFEPLSKL